MENSPSSARFATEISFLVGENGICGLKRDVVPTDGRTGRRDARRSNIGQKGEVPLIFRRAAIISPPHDGTGTGGSLRRAPLSLSLSLICLSFIFHFSRL